MKKVLYFDWHEDATSFYRLSPLSFIHSKDFVIHRSTTYQISFATMVGYDVVIIERPSSLESLNVIKLAKDMGIKVIFDFDDDCLHIDQYNPMYSLYQQQMPNVIECLVLADEVWVSTAGVKKSFKLYNKNIHVINNAHNDYLFPVNKKKAFNPKNKTAVWRGGNSHSGDMYDIGVPEKIVETVNSNPDWTFKFIGQRFEYLEKRCGDNYIAQSGASTVQFYKMLHEENPMVFFYPLADTVFNRCKSNICWLEATYSGAAFLGNTQLPEYEEGSIMDFINFALIGVYDSEFFEFYNRVSWDIVQEKYLLSQINELRKERLLLI